MSYWRKENCYSRYSRCYCHRPSSVPGQESREPDRPFSALSAFYSTWRNGKPILRRYFKIRLLGNWNGFPRGGKHACVLTNDLGNVGRNTWRNPITAWSELSCVHGGFPCKSTKPNWVLGHRRGCGKITRAELEGNLRLHSPDRQSSCHGFQELDMTFSMMESPFEGIW